MIDKFNIQTIEEVLIENSRVLVRVDYNVSMNSQHKIANDMRIKQSIPTIKKLLKQNNRVILITHLGDPEGHDLSLSLAPIIADLRSHLPGVIINLLEDFTSEKSKIFLEQQAAGEIVMFENLRFNKGEKENDLEFAQSLSQIADYYVNDAFGVSHREHASVVLLPGLLPSLAGLLMAHEINTIDHVVNHPKPPFVALVGGSKISTKITFLRSLIDKVDTLLIGGGLANTFLKAAGNQVGLSLHEEATEQAKEILKYAEEKNKKVIIPLDAVVVDENNADRVVSITEVGEYDSIVDIGPQTEAAFGEHLATAKTILWNGPVGKAEDDRFARGTEYVYYAIAQNKDVISLVGGGDTIAAISKLEYADRITHISTGGGAMMEFIEKGTLPGITALELGKQVQDVHSQDSTLKMNP